MKRTLLLVTALAGIATTVFFKRPQATPVTPSRHAPSDESVWTWVEDRARPVLYANHPVALQDSVSEAEALRLIERLYRYKADIMAAQASGNHRTATHLIDGAMAELNRLVERPGLTDHKSFRAVYQAIAAEYQERYGIRDTIDLPQGDIYQVRQELFAALNSDETPQLEDVIPTDVRLAHTEVPMDVNERVRESIAFLMRYPNLHIYPWLRRSATYFPMIEHVFAEEDVPDELKYLALLESGLNPWARSHAKAAGLWQFIAPTGRMYGLTVDPWVDERLDPEKATRAAARHLRDLHDMFGDWHLALAGYNCSPAVIRRAVRKAERRLGRKATFWDIYQDLPEETRNYVPLYIASALIVSNPSAFDLERVTPGPRYAFDHVPMQGALHLDTVARLAETTVSKIRALNPELRTDRLPPSKEPYYVRLPYGSYQTFASNYQQLPHEDRVMRVVHTVRPGETVARIAERYHVDRPSLITSSNTHPAIVYVGQQLTIPEVSYSGNAALAEAVKAEPIRVRYSTRAQRPVAVADASPLEGLADFEDLIDEETKQMLR